MIQRILFSILIFFGAVLEATVFPFPVVFVLSVILFVFFEGMFSLSIIFLAGVLLDILVLNKIGYTPLIIFSFLIVLVALEHVFSFRSSYFLGRRGLNAKD